MSDKIVTPKFRGSYVAAAKPRQPKGGEGEPKYGITIVLPKADKKTKEFIASLKKSFNDAMVEKFGKVVPDSALKHYPIRDGNTPDEDGEIPEEFKDCWVIVAKNSRQPGLVIKRGAVRTEVDDPEFDIGKFYSGAYYYATVTVYAWKHETGGKGVSVSLSGLMQVAEGEKFGAGSHSPSDFDGVGEDDGDEV
jgi:hypothetical protein